MELGLRDDEAAADGVEDIGGEEVTAAVESGEPEAVGMRGGSGFGAGVGGGVGGEGCFSRCGNIFVGNGREGGCGSSGDGIHLVAVEEEVLGFDEGDLVAAKERKALLQANGGDGGLDGGWVHRVGSFAGEAEEDSAVGAVADAGEGERAVEVDEDMVRAVEAACGVELADEAESGAHGADGVGAGGAYADLEELEETGVHFFILGFAGLAVRSWAGDVGLALWVSCLDLTWL